MYLHEHDNWTSFTWDDSVISPLVGDVRFAQGHLLGSMRDVGFDVENETELDALSAEVVASSRIEGVVLDVEKVRSSVSRQLGFEVSGDMPDTRDVDGPVAVMLDATKRAESPLDHERLRSWHSALFPMGYSGLRKIHVAQYRTSPMQVVSGAIGRERVHFTAPDAEKVEPLMAEFLSWFNGPTPADPVVKAGLAHLWFLTIHPFDDGNGRIARALTELLLARSDHAPQRFYSMAGQILSDREAYYRVLEQAQKGDSDVTAWLVWFLHALQASIDRSFQTLQAVLDRSAFWRGLEGVPLNDRQRLMLAKLKGDFEGSLTASKWAKICKVSPDTALRDINDLVAKDVLVQGEKGGRSTSYKLR